MNARLIAVVLRSEHDVVVARQRARQIARHLGFEAQDQARIATAVSEIARNVTQYAGGGRIAFSLEGRTAPQILTIIITDEGPGIPDLELVLSGRYRSQTGMGLGLLGARRLMDQFRIESVPGRGTSVQLRKFLPRSAPVRDGAAASEVAAALAREGLQNPLAEVQQQNQEILQTLDELRRRQEELERLNRELEDTNRGVVALYAELDEKAEHLRRADEMKTRFLSNMSHEFRTPLNSILALSRLLERRTDGPLTPEQEKQVGFITKAALDLTEIVDDLLDLAKVEAGKIVVRPAEFDLLRLFGALRGMLRPLLVTDTVRLVFEEPSGLPLLYGDEGKVSQILRNLLSNALKFTESGEIRIWAALGADRETIEVSVSDTGIGIAPEDQARIFEEFGQVEHAVQRKTKGTGLGLALSRRLAEVLGGTLTVRSTLGGGSTFTLRLPVAYAPRPTGFPETWETDPRRAPVLIVDDDPASHHVYERLFRGSEFQPLPARTVRDAEAWLRTGRARAVVFDIVLLGEDAWRLLADLKDRPEHAHLPVIVVSNVDDEPKALALGADAYRTPPVPEDWLLTTLRRLTARTDRRVLVVDDDDASRYVMRELVRRLGLATEEVADGAEGARKAMAAPPSAMLLDLVMKGLNGAEVLRLLRADPTTEHLPVVVATAKKLERGEREELEQLASVVLSKSRLSSPDAEAALADALRRACAAAGQPTLEALGPGGGS
jgi:signal transduction histidine kinase/CheY-like chemotaxis protein